MERKQDAFSSLYLWWYTTEAVSKFRFKEWIYTSNEINRLYIFSLHYHQQIRYSRNCLISSHTDAVNEKDKILPKQRWKSSHFAEQRRWWRSPGRPAPAQLRLGLTLPAESLDQTNTIYRNTK